MRHDLKRAPVVENFGPFELLRRIDRGGMGEIFLARRRLAGGGFQVVALKRLLPQFSGDETYVQMFTDEARLARLMRHPGVCRVHESGLIGGQYYLAMEWVDGISLAALIKRTARRGLTLDVALRVLIDLAAAVEYSHHLTDERGRLLGVVHRDVSPPNVMIAFDGGVKLLDFGLAKAKTQRYATRTGFTKGKLRYLAPEQLQEGRDPDWLIDIFGLGQTAYEALLGRYLFDVVYPVDAVTELRRYVDPPYLRQIRPDLPEPLEEIVRRALEPDPAMRYQSAGKMRQDLEAVLETVAPGFDRAQLEGRLLELVPPEIR